MIAKRPLTGIRILDLTHVLSGPFATMLLADAGAEVIKIERPDGGERFRSLGPHREREGKRISGSFLRANRSKKGITLNLKHSEGRALFISLVAQADVVAENFKTGTMENLGLGYEVLREINPRLIYLSITGFGHPREGGTYCDWPAVNTVAQALGGIMDISGSAEGPPVECGAPIGDLFPGALAAMGVVLALVSRIQTGVGQRIDVSMYEAMLMLNERSVMNYQVTGEVPTRGAERVVAPRGPFPAKDGYFAFAIYTLAEWQSFCRVVGRPDLSDRPDLQTGRSRAVHMETLIVPLIETWACTMTKHEASRRLVEGGISAAPVQNAAELFTCPHLTARGAFVSVLDPVLDEIKYPRDPIVMSGSATPEYSAAPLLGEHNASVYEELLGLSKKELDQLVDNAVI
jgi:CoA:oxalate CoA-transferase